LISRPLAIADEGYNYTNTDDLLSSYDGGSNSIESPFYVGDSNKSISLTITGDSNLFEYIQIAAVKRTLDDGSISQVECLTPIPFTAGSASFLYTGDPSQIEYTTNIEEILVPNLRVDIVKAHVIKNDRLLIGNVSSDTYRDYTSYQQYASKIKTEWKKAPVTNPTSSKSKKAEYYFSDASFMEDDTVALGIAYVFSSGEVSPVFHIPGRAPDVVPNTAYNPYIGSAGVPFSNAPWDTGIQTYGDLVVGTSGERWKQISTALSYNSGVLEGLMGYHESNSTYPDIQPCTTLPNGYWGVDWQNNLIQPNVTPIRHHRLPAPELRETAATAHGFRTGIVFSNVEYPPNQNIVGHYFLYGDSTYDSSIKGKGLLIPLKTSSNSVTIDADTLRATSYAAIDYNDNNYLFISEEPLYLERIVNGDYFRTEKILIDPVCQSLGPAGITSLRTRNIPTDEATPAGASLSMDISFRNFTTYTNPSATNLVHTILNTTLLPHTYQGAVEGNEVFELGTSTTIKNNSTSNTYQFLHLASGQGDVAAAGGA
jgi:hypothetical protein